MGSGGYYLGGDRDDHGNYSPKEFIFPNPEEYKKQPQTKAVQPKNYFNIDLEFFYKKYKEATKGSRDYWDWACFISFAKNTANLYAQVLSAFYNLHLGENKTFGHEETIANLKIAVEKQRGIEAKLVAQFGRTGRDVQVFINRYAKARSVVDLGAEAWTIYHTIASKIDSKDLDVSSILTLSKRIKTDMDTSTELSDLEVFRNAKSIDKKMRQTGLTSLFLNLHNPILYRGQNVAIYLDKLIGLYCGVSLIDLRNIIDRFRARLKAGKLKPFVAFYDNYSKINKTIVDLKIAKSTWEQNKEAVALFVNDEGEDVYTLAQTYLVVCEELNELAQKYNYKYIKDIQTIVKELTQLTNATSAVYLEHEKYNAELDAKINKILNRTNKN